MNEIINFFNTNQKLELNFTSVTNLNELKLELNKAQKESGITYTLDESCTFNYDKGVSIRKGTGGTSKWKPYARDMLKTLNELVFNNCPIPNKIRLVAHTQQVSNCRCLFSISIKINQNTFFLADYIDGSNGVISNTGEGLYIDGESKLVYPISNNLMNIDYSSSINQSIFPNFYNFVGNNKVCNIVVHNLRYYRDNSTNNSSYPFYIENLEIEF